MQVVSNWENIYKCGNDTGRMPLAIFRRIMKKHVIQRNFWATFKWVWSVMNYTLRNGFWCNVQWFRMIHSKKLKTSEKNFIQPAMFLIFYQLQFEYFFRKNTFLEEYLWEKNFKNRTQFFFRTRWAEFNVMAVLGENEKSRK